MKHSGKGSLSKLTVFCCLLAPLVFSHCVRPVTPPPISAVPPREEVEIEPAGEYLLVDTAQKTLRLRKDGATKAEFKQLALGSGGAGIKRRRGDNITPLGKFTIGWINPASKFKLFIGLNYPSLEYAERGLREGVIKQKDFDRIRSAVEKGKQPPQNTPLGGLIGIHGIGKGSLEIHHLIDWTDGCIALDNKQIEQLRALVRPGMLVIIR